MEQPKRALSPYMYFCIDNRDQIKKDNPHMKFGQIAQKMGRLWRDYGEI